MIKTTTALRKISAMKKRIRMVRGGQGAGKTITWLILICNSASSTQDRNWLIASEELTKMKDSVISDFEMVMKGFGIWEDHRWNKSEFVYTYANGNIVKFRSMDKEDAGKGVRKFYGVYFNEINKIKFESYNQYASRCRVVVGDWNPDAPFFVDDQVLSREDCEFLQLTYRDNEFLDETERNEIEGYLKKGYKNTRIPEGFKLGQRYHKSNIKDAYWANKWQVYGLGNIGSLMGAIFSNWEIIEDVPEEARLRSGGLDFGYTNDPTAIVARYQWNGCPVYDEIEYKTGMLNKDIASVIKKSVLAYSTIYCDSAEPKSVDELRKTYKIKAVGVDKGRDSLRYGIDLLQQYPKIYVTRRSVNLISNFRNYIWEVDRNGKPTNQPVDKNNHGIDACRYEEVGKGKFNGKYIVR
jgi:phage terminase large subunit